MRWLYTDSGSGGTKEDLALEMSKLSWTIDMFLFLTVTWYLHAMRLMMFSPCKKCFDYGIVAISNACNYCAHVSRCRTSLRWKNGNKCGAMKWLILLVKDSQLQSAPDGSTLACQVQSFMKRAVFESFWKKGLAKSWNSNIGIQAKKAVTLASFCKSL